MWMRFLRRLGGAHAPSSINTWPKASVSMTSTCKLQGSATFAIITAYTYTARGQTCCHSVFRLKTTLPKEMLCISPCPCEACAQSPARRGTAKGDRQLTRSSWYHRFPAIVCAGITAQLLANTVLCPASNSLPTRTASRSVSAPGDRWKLYRAGPFELTLLHTTQR